MSHFGRELPADPSVRNVRVWTPLRMQEVFVEAIGAQVQVRPCVRPTGAAVHGTAGLYGDRGSGPHRFRALEALGHIPWFSRPRLLTVAPYLSWDLPASLTASDRLGFYAAAVGAL